MLCFYLFTGFDQIFRNGSGPKNNWSDFGGMTNFTIYSELRSKSGSESDWRILLF